MKRLNFIGNNFDIWSNKMKNFLKSENLWNFVEFGLEDPRDEANDPLAFYFIQQCLDDSIFFKLVVANTSKKDWEILNKEFNVRGSSTKSTINQIVEAIVNPAKADESNEEVNFIVFVNEAEHKDIVNVDEVQCVYPIINDEGNEKSNIEIEEENNEDIVHIIREAKDKNENDNLDA